MATGGDLGHHSAPGGEVVGLAGDQLTEYLVAIVDEGHRSLVATRFDTHDNGHAGTVGPEGPGQAR